MNHTVHLKKNGSGHSINTEDKNVDSLKGSLRGLTDRESLLVSGGESTAYKGLGGKVQAAADNAGSAL